MQKVKKGVHQRFAHILMLYQRQEFHFFERQRKITRSKGLMELDPREVLAVLATKQRPFYVDRKEMEVLKVASSLLPPEQRESVRSIMDALTQKQRPRLLEGQLQELRNVFSAFPPPSPLPGKCWDPAFGNDVVFVSRMSGSKTEDGVQQEEGFFSKAKRTLLAQFSPPNGPKIHLYPVNSLAAAEEASQFLDNPVVLWPVVSNCDVGANELPLIVRGNYKILLVPSKALEDANRVFLHAAVFSSNLILSAGMAINHYEALQRLRNCFDHIAFTDCSLALDLMETDSKKGSAENRLMAMEDRLVKLGE